MKEFEVGDIVSVKLNKLTEGSLKTYNLELDKTYKVALYSENRPFPVVMIQGNDYEFPANVFELSRRNEESIQKPVLEERKKNKIRMELVDQGFPNALLELAKVMTWANENKGYKDHDWKNIPNAENAFKGAAARHRVKFDAQRSFGNEMLDCTDEESGIIHLAHELFNTMALLELALAGKVK